MQSVKFSFLPHIDDRGQLIAIEEYKDIPFQIRRVYYLFGTAHDTVRGKHAHKKLEQVLICVHGSCRIRLDDGTEHITVLLDNPCEGLHIANNIWREMFDFSPGAVLLVLASEPYDESDYIRDYDDFLAEVKSGNE